MKKEKVLTETVKDLFNTIGDDDILKELDDGTWRFENRTLDKQTQSLLIAQSKRFRGEKLWEILQKDIKWQANKQMFEKGTSETDIILGKAWMYVIDCINTRLKNMEKGIGFFNLTPQETEKLKRIQKLRQLNSPR